MRRISSDTRPPFLGPAFPSYPLLRQLVRVTGTPSGGVYPVKVEQWQSTGFRDRETGFAFEVNGATLTGSTYKARLVGNFNNQPLWAISTACCVGAGSFSSSSSSSRSSSSLSSRSPSPSSVSVSPSSKSVSPPSLASVASVAPVVAASSSIRSSSSSSPRSSSSSSHSLLSFSLASLSSFSSFSSGVLVPCCFNPLPQIIHVTLTGFGGAIADGTYQLDFFAGFPGWHTSVVIGTCAAGSPPWDAAHAPAIFLNCVIGLGGLPQWNLFVQDNLFGSLFFNDPAVSCNPFQINFLGTGALSVCGAAVNGNMVFTL